MKKRLLIPLVVFLAVTGVGIVATYWPRPVPWDECSELYRRYADSPDVRAAYIKDYQLSDTLTICATILEAANDTGWCILQHDFKIPVLPEEYMVLLETNNSIDVKLRPRDHPELPMDTNSILNNDVIATNRKTRTICIFRIDNPEYIHAIVTKKTHEEVTPRNKR